MTKHGVRTKIKCNVWLTSLCAISKHQKGPNNLCRCKTTEPELQKYRANPWFRPDLSPFLCCPAATSFKNSLLVQFHCTKRDSHLPLHHPQESQGRQTKAEVQTNRSLSAHAWNLSSQLNLRYGAAGCSGLQLKAVKEDGEHLVLSPQLKPIQPYPKDVCQALVAVLWTG